MVIVLQDNENLENHLTDEWLLHCMIRRQKKCKNVWLNSMGFELHPREFSSDPATAHHKKPSQRKQNSDA